jgi:molybdenum cofactor biosynthesis enzyme MoaA
VGEIRSRRLATVPEQLYAELTAEVADLAEAVARVALHVKINAVIADAAEVERTAEALRTASGRATEWVEPQSRREASSVDIVISHDAQVSRIAESATIGNSLQRNGWIDDANKNEMDVVDELCAARSDLAKVDAALAKPKDASRGAENAIAARVLELHDRLGGFIKPHLLPLS